MLGMMNGNGKKPMRIKVSLYQISNGGEGYGNAHYNQNEEQKKTPTGI
jgi:hypothetical protein